jgi:hypothetical protein
MSKEEVLQRQTDLAEELARKATRAGVLGKRNHSIVVTMAVLAVCASVAAGLLGLLELLSSKWIGTLALLPAGLTVASSTLKLQAKANWYYESELGLNNLLHRLRYELPDPPSVDNVAAVSEAWRTFATERENIWSRTLTLDWSNLGKKD